MRADEEKSAGGMESLLAPFTPAKPISLMQRQIYPNVQENESNLDSFSKMEAYMSRVSQENQAQVSAEGSNNIHYPPEIVGNANRAVGWTPLYGPPTQLSASTSNINPVLESLPFTYNYHMGHMLPRVSSTDPLGQWSYVTFSDLLAMNTGGVPAAKGGSQTAMTSNAFLPNLNSQAHLMFEHQGIMGSVQNIMAGPNKTAQELQGLNQHDQDRTLELNQRIENHQSGFSISSRNSYDLNSYPEPENALTSEERPANMMSAFPDDGLRGFAPVTPDNFKKIASSAPGETYSPADMQNAKHSEVLVPGVDSLLEINETRSATDSIVIESYHPDKESNHELQLDLDQNKPTQQKTRRKKHRPKVVIEGKPKRPPTQRKPGPGVATETPRQKRKYIRKNKTNMPSKTPPPAGAETLGSKVASPSVKSCRKTLNFDLEDQANEDNFFQISSNMASSEQLQHIQEEKDVNEAAHGSDAFDINVRNNQILKDCMSIPERDAQNVSQPTKTTPTQYDPSAAIESESGRKKGRQTAVGSKKRTSAEALHPIDTFTHSSHYTTCASTNEGEHNKSVKWTNPSLSDASNMASHCPTLQVNHMRLGNAIFSNNQGMYFPVIYKKRRTEKVFKPNTLPNTTSLEDYPTEATNTSKYYYPTPVHCNLVARPSTQATATHHLDKTQFRIWADIDKLKRKRSKVTTRVRNLDSLKGLAECRGLSRSTAKQRVRHISTKDAKALNNLPSMEALPVVHSARRTGKRQSRKRRTKMKSIMSSFDILFGGNSQGPSLALPWKDTTLVDAVIEGMKQLNINKEGSSARDQHPNIIIPYSTQYQQQNALVLYKRDGTMIPFKESEANKFKAKVDLDDETIRVWKLLLEDINSQGIDGTDEEKKKWWKTERNVFHGRVDSFIARMRLVQGDRHFSPWKGSVVDSVVGVFLTQNVSDHLSSSAFMTVAARFPLKSGQEIRTRVNENIGPFIEEPDICSIDLNDNIESLAWNEKTVEGPICDRNSRTLHDLDVSEEKVVNSKESHGSPSLKDETFCHVDSSQEKTLESQMYGGSIIRKESEIVGVSADATSSQHSVISSQSSAESPSAPTSGTMGSVISSEGEILTTNSNPSSLHCSASFVELLRMAETPKLNVAYSPKDQALSYQSGVPDQEGIREDTAEVLDSYSNVNKCPTLYQLCMTEGDNIKGVDEESRSVNSATSTKNLSTQQTKTTVSRSNESPLVDNVCSYYVLEGEELIIQQNITNSQEERSENSPKSNANPPTLSMVETDVTESTCASNITVHNEFIPNQPLSEHNHTSRETQNVSNKDTTKKKKGTAKKAAYDWESLRKRAQVNGKSRQHTANTMDSVDWEAVRHADVNDVADTIKDRGMNNVLAERIQAFLNRIVKDHGSIDLEWLRDIPPDKAKEYLLSINGIGLKSVECVRLLTLHQLAFPVDTNVGRIAVRLGWVPLQPLPESLQLHLLEMYPILESIQKYLWPRLCKLDQRTLYELHYHMITFGKVFCTKKQPNCNACPLRGECRHFASAFTSSKLALPGPEDKSIVPSCKSNVIYQDPRATINYLPMPLPIEDHMLEVKSAAKNYEPIVEIPASPEPEQIQTSEYDIEDALNDDPNEIPTIKLNMEEFSHNLQTYMQSNMELQEGDMSKALVALATEAASIPTPKLKNVNRLRTEHRVYELPDTHQLLRGLDKREPDDPCSYLLAIWTPGETANSIEAPEKRCNSQEQGELCGDETCFYCNSLREANKQTVRGTLLIPCRTAMRGSFPLNGTYFQVNETMILVLNQLKSPGNGYGICQEELSTLAPPFRAYSKACLQKAFNIVSGKDMCVLEVLTGKHGHPVPLWLDYIFQQARLQKTSKRQQMCREREAISIEREKEREVTSIEDLRSFPNLQANRCEYPNIGVL